MTPPAELSVAADTFITSEREKLPADVQALLDPRAPIPMGSSFYEKRITMSDLLSAILWFVGLSIVGFFSVVIGIAILFDLRNPQPGTNSMGFVPIFFGITCGVASWFMAMTFFNGRKLMDAQRRGQPTRIGIFLTAETLIEATETTWTVIPRSHFRGVDESTLRYQLKGQEKSFRLPRTLMRCEQSQLVEAIRRWASSTS